MHGLIDYSSSCQVSIRPPPRVPNTNISGWYLRVRHLSKHVTFHSRRDSARSDNRVVEEANVRTRRVHYPVESEVAGGVAPFVSIKVPR